MVPGPVVPLVPVPLFPVVPVTVAMRMNSWRERVSSRSVSSWRKSPSGFSTDAEPVELVVPVPVVAVAPVGSVRLVPVVLLSLAFGVRVPLVRLGSLGSLCLCCESSETSVCHGGLPHSGVGVLRVCAQSHVRGKNKGLLAGRVNSAIGDTQDSRQRRNVIRPMNPPLFSPDGLQDVAQRRRILLVDDHPAFRQGVRSLLLGFEKEFTVCAEADSAAGAMTHLRAQRPDIAVLDVTLPGANGIELIKMMLSEVPRLPILVLSMHDESVYAVRALRAGARGYISKTDAMESIVTALRRIATGKIYVSPALSEQLIFRALDSIQAGGGSPVDKLSDRELEVLEHLGKGRSTRDIAEALRLSAKTVETHRARLKEKLHLADQVQVVRFAMDWTESGELMEPRRVRTMRQSSLEDGTIDRTGNATVNNRASTRA